MSQVKICTECQSEKTLNEFHKELKGKYGVRSKCIECTKNLYQVNKTKVLNRNKQYRELNKEKIKCQKRQYRSDNSESIAQKKKQYRQNNVESLIEYFKQYRNKNKEIIATRTKKWRESPNGVAVKRAHSQFRRAVKKSSGGSYSGADIIKLIELQSGVCPYCKSNLLSSNKNNYHIDHIEPLSKGGSNDISNIQLLCPKCNLSKGNKSPQDFASKFNQLF